VRPPASLREDPVQGRCDPTQRHRAHLYCLGPARARFRAVRGSGCTMELGLPGWKGERSKGRLKANTKECGVGNRRARWPNRFIGFRGRGLGRHVCERKRSLMDGHASGVVALEASLFCLPCGDPIRAVSSHHHSVPRRTAHARSSARSVQRTARSTHSVFRREQDAKGRIMICAMSQAPTACARPRAQRPSKNGTGVRQRTPIESGGITWNSVTQKRK
jgi:hypothetical protein